MTTKRLDYKGSSSLFNAFLRTSERAVENMMLDKFGAFSSGGPSGRICA